MTYRKRLKKQHIAISKEVEKMMARRAQRLRLTAEWKSLVMPVYARMEHPDD